MYVYICIHIHIHIHMHIHIHLHIYIYLWEAAEKALPEGGRKTGAPCGPALSRRPNRKHVKYPLKPLHLRRLQEIALARWIFVLWWYNFNTGTAVSGGRLDFRSLVVQLWYWNGCLRRPANLRSLVVQLYYWHGRLRRPAGFRFLVV